MDSREKDMLLESKNRNSLPDFYIDQQLKEKYRNGNKTRRRIEKSLN